MTEQAQISLESIIHSYIPFYLASSLFHNFVTVSHSQALLSQMFFWHARLGLLP